MVNQDLVIILLCNNILYIYILGAIIFTVFLFHILIKFLSWMLLQKYGVKLKIGGYKFLSFYDIHLQLKDGLKLEIEDAGLSSCLFNSSHKSLIVFYINDIRLQGDTDWIIAHTASKKNSSVHKKSTFSILRYISILKFISLHVLNASVMQLGKSDEEFLLHFSFQELNIFCRRNDNSVQLNASVMSSSVKVFKHLPVDQEQEQSTEACICHFSSNLHLSFHLVPGKSALIQAINVNIAEPEIMLYEGFSVSKFKTYLQNGFNTRKYPGYDNEETVPSYSSSDIKQKINKLPQMSDITIDLFSVKVMMKGGHRTFLFGIKLVSWHFEIGDILEEEPFPRIVSNIQVKDVSAASDHVQIGQLHRFDLDLNMTERILDAKLNLSLLHLLYEKEVLQYFLSMLLLNTQKVNLKPASNIKKKKTFFELLHGYKVKATIEVDNICASFKIPKCETFSFGLVSGQSSLEHYLCDKGSDDYKLQSVSGGSCVELLLDTVYLKLGDSAFSEYGMLKRYHFCNIPLAIGVILLKARLSHVDNCIECMFDGSQLQWCPSLCNVIFYLQKFIVCNFSPHASTEAHKNAQQIGTFESPAAERKNTIKSVELNFTGLNIFALSELNTGIAVRTDALNLSSTGEKSKVSIEGMKLLPFTSVVQIYQCVRSSEIKNFNMHLKEASIVYTVKKKEATLILKEDIYLLWNTTLHMTTLTIVQESFSFKNNIENCYREHISKNNVLKLDESDENSNGIFPTKTYSESKPIKAVSVFLQAAGRIDIGWTLSKKHKFMFSSSDVNLNYCSGALTANSEHLAMVFDNHEVFVFEKIILSLMPGNEQHQLCRQGFDALELPNNRLLSFRFDHVKFVFPYKYNFAEAFSEEFINIIKWLKIVHKKKKIPFTLESKLPPDLQIICKLWTIELEDDPFEVKLRDNFELLEDEYQESLKRKAMLDEKVETFRRTNLLLQNEKINVLYSKLAKKNAEIYIQRSQQLCLKGPMRTSLCLWTLEDVDIIAIADTSYHGTERVVNRIRTLDPESPYPDEGLEFTTLWARKVRCTVTSWNWQMRDFPQLPLNIRELHIWGFLIGAEQEASQRAKRSSVVEIDEPWGNFTIERSMPSLKYYHDLTFDMEEMSMAYGPSWEPVMAQISLAMELVSRPSLDPSPALPWWDKMRLLYHGRFTLLSQHLTLFMRASLDPYNITEHMEISWSEVFIEWTNGNLPANFGK